MDYGKIAEEFCRIRAVNARKIEQIERTVSARGEANILLLLAGADKEMLAGELSRSSGLSVSRVTNILNSLEKKGLIARRSDCADKRKVYIALTDTGRAYIMEKHTEVVRQYEKVFRRLGEEDSLEYLRLMKKFSDIMNEEIDRELMERLSR